MGRGALAPHMFQLRQWRESLLRSLGTRSGLVPATLPPLPHRSRPPPPPSATTPQRRRGTGNRRPTIRRPPPHSQIVAPLRTRVADPNIEETTQSVRRVFARRSTRKAVRRAEGMGGERRALGLIRRNSKRIEFGKQFLLYRSSAGC